MGSSYPNLHGHKNNWSYAEVYNVGLLFDDFADRLSKKNIREAKSILEKSLTVFYFEPITLHFSNVKLLIENVDNAATTLCELNKIEDKYL